MTTDKSKALEALDNLFSPHKGIVRPMELLNKDYRVVKAALEEGYNYYATQEQINELCKYANKLNAEITRLKAALDNCYDPKKMDWAVTPLQQELKAQKAEIQNLENMLNNERHRHKERIKNQVNKAKEKQAVKYEAEITQLKASATYKAFLEQQKAFLEQQAEIARLNTEIESLKTEIDVLEEKISVLIRIKG